MNERPRPVLPLRRSTSAALQRAAALLLASTAGCGAAPTPAPRPADPQVAEAPSEAESPHDLAALEPAASEAPSVHLGPTRAELDQRIESLVEDGGAAVFFDGAALYLCEEDTCAGPLPLSLAISLEGLQITAMTATGAGPGVWAVTTEWERQVGDVHELGSGALFLDVANRDHPRIAGHLTIAASRVTRGERDALERASIDHPAARLSPGCMWLGEVTAERERSRTGRPWRGAGALELELSPRTLPQGGVDPFAFDQGGGWRLGPSMVATDACSL
jgi:hypothetical protein